MRALKATPRFAALRDAVIGLSLFGLAALLSPCLSRAGADEPRPLSPAPISPDSPPRVASYTISARLDAETHVVSATGTIEFRNRSRAPLAELYFHLYLNAFKNEKSLFLRSPFGEGRGGARAGDWGYIDVQRLVARELGGVDLWPGRAAGTTTEPDDETDVRVPLPRPLEPGEALTLELEWKAKLPRVVLRTGYARDFHFVGQWFPKLARLEPDGRFAHFPFHPQAEFYADYGDYDVTLDVPSAAVVGATGERVEQRASGARRRERYRATAVHDFAWTAWPGFVERNARIDGVAVRLLYPRGYDASADITLDTLSRALPLASQRYGRYPYPVLTVVHPPETAAEAGGMEYPTLITTGGAWFFGRFGDRALESVTIHELLHQWFYGLVASNEAAAPFLDEGLTSFAELSLLESEFGPGSAFRGLGIELSATALARLLSATRAEDLPVASPAATFPGFRSLAALVYSRTATLLATLGRVYGERKLERALAGYTARQRFGHPRGEDFVTVVREELGPEAARVLELGLEARGRVDYLVRDLENAREHQPAGVFDGQNGRETLEVRSSPEPAWRGRAVVYRHGNLELPVDIELVGADGSRSRERWDGREPFHVVEWRGRVPLSSVVVDPERRVLIDDDLLNNAVASAPAVPRRTLERATYASQVLFSLFGP
jgi:hypothetical protein